MTIFSTAFQSEEDKEKYKSLPEINICDCKEIGGYILYDGDNNVFLSDFSDVFEMDIFDDIHGTSCCAGVYFAHDWENIPEMISSECILYPVKVVTFDSDLQNYFDYDEIEQNILGSQFSEDGDPIVFEFSPERRKQVSEKLSELITIFNDAIPESAMPDMTKRISERSLFEELQKYCGVEQEKKHGNR